MTGSESLKVVTDLIFTIQRMRSIYFETVGQDETAEAVGAKLQPWVFGPNCLLSALTTIEESGKVQPMDLFNFCTIAHQLSPGRRARAPATTPRAVGTEIGVSAAVFNRTVPEPDTAWLSGWA